MSALKTYIRVTLNRLCRLHLENIYIIYAYNNNKKEDINLKESKQGIGKSLEGGREREKCFNYIIYKKQRSNK